MVVSAGHPLSPPAARAFLAGRFRRTAMPIVPGGIEQAMELRTESFRADWSDANDTKRWLQREVFVGEVLNFPCGSSDLGDIRADVDPDLNPDVVARLEAWPFEKNTFDTVYLDPPFSLWSQSRGGFIMDAWRTARERLVCQTGLEKVTIPNSEPQFFINRPRGPGFSLKVFQVFDRLDRRIDEF